MTCTTERAALAVRKILSCYPLAKPNDPRAYAVALTAVLDGNPQWMVERIEAPRRGIASRCRFLPTPADLTDMLNELRDEEARAKPREYFRALPHPPPTEADREWAKRTVAEMKQDFARRDLGRPLGGKNQIFRRGQRDAWEKKTT